MLHYTKHIYTQTYMRTHKHMGVHKHITKHVLQFILFSLKCMKVWLIIKAVSIEVSALLRLTNV